MSLFSSVICSFFFYLASNLNIFAYFFLFFFNFLFNIFFDLFFITFFLFISVCFFFFCFVSFCYSSFFQFITFIFVYFLVFPKFLLFLCSISINKFHSYNISNVRTSAFIRIATLWSNSRQVQALKQWSSASHRYSERAL